MASDKDIFDMPVQGVEVNVQSDPAEPPKPLKAPRKKREMTPEQKEALLERLRKGRETARANRKAKASGNEPVPQKIKAPSGQSQSRPAVGPAVGPAPHGGGGGSSEMMAEVKALRAELAELRADKAESRRLKAEERIKKAKSNTPHSAVPLQKPEPTEPPKVSPSLPPPVQNVTTPVVETEQYYDARTGQVKTRTKRK